MLLPLPGGLLCFVVLVVDFFLFLVNSNHHLMEFIAVLTEHTRVMDYILQSVRATSKV